MSSLFDVTQISVNNDEFTSSIDTVQEVTVQVLSDVTAVTITSDSLAEIVEVQVPGMQGPRGVQNVYVSQTDPSKDELGNTIWGEEQEGYVWIEY